MCYCNQMYPKACISISRQKVYSSPDFTGMTLRAAMLFSTGGAPPCRVFDICSHSGQPAQGQGGPALSLDHTPVCHVISHPIRFHLDVDHRLTSGLSSSQDLFRLSLLFIQITARLDLGFQCLRLISMKVRSL